MLSKYIAKELKNPSAIVGEYVLAPLWNKRNSRLHDCVIEKMTVESSDKILEIGFGGGRSLEIVSKLVTDGIVAGVDISKSMTRYCQKKFGGDWDIDVKCASASELPFDSNCFNKIYSVNSIFYWNDVEKACSEIFRVMSAGGVLFLCYTAKESLQKKKFVKNGLKLFEPCDVKELLLIAGFENINTTRHSDNKRKYYCTTGSKPA